MDPLFTCPSGHKLTYDHFHSTVNMDVADPTLDDIMFSCDGGKSGHSFTLKKAVNRGMFTADMAEKIREHAKLHLITYR